MRSIRAMIVEDHTIVADGLERILQLSGRVEVIASARSLREAKVVLKRTTPDVILLDLRLPDSQGAADLGDLIHAEQPRASPTRRGRPPSPVSGKPAPGRYWSP